MKKMLIVMLFVLVFPHHAFAEKLEEKTTYRLNKTVYDLKRVGSGEEGFIAAIHSKFIVVDAGGKEAYVIRFIKIHNFSEIQSTVREDGEYRLPKAIDGVEVSKSVEVSFGGLVSGPLIVPFKFRLDDDSITGEATLGYYAGYSFEPMIPRTNIRVPFSPFISGGISQIAVEGNGTPDNRTGFTIAAGILVQNWAGVNIGIVYGQDRIGDKSWEHEGDAWFSFMIGWAL